ncbi:hypothetical protein SLS55_002375 [Diplodia seriata]|uniref:Alpha/beta hydrolase fold-3 domain-containing protein n=2 Tax=Diplodia seriata TaxID=420778 RepID=A0ABR3CS14_9PEZI
MYDTYDEVAKLGIRDPEFTKYIKENGYENMASFAELPGLDASSGAVNSSAAQHGYIIDVPMRDGHLNPLRVHKPTSPPANGKSPLVVLIYGGGFLVGDNTQMSPFARILNELHGATVVNLSYRLVPSGHRWPTQPNDVWDNLQWIAANAETQLGADPSAGFIVGGASAGANLAAVAAQRWIGEKQEPALTGLHIGIPVLFVEPNVPAAYRDLWFSREQNRDAFILNAAAVDALMDKYGPDTASPDWCPLNAENALVGYPRTYVSACGEDPLRDDGLVYWRLLRDRGAETRIDVAPGVPHAHATFEGLVSGQKSNFASVAAFGWLLRDEKMPEDIIQGMSVLA